MKISLPQKIPFLTIWGLGLGPRFLSADPIWTQGETASYPNTVTHEYLPGAIKPMRTFPV
ncbi:MAG: hypothetical protein Q4D17_02590 [Planctomycetia bacterium]|nr:hypothetical protein [Planctomycetia bacterium]